MRRILTMSVAIALVLTFLVSPASASDAGHQICLNDMRTECVDVPDSSYVNGQALWLYNQTDGKGLGFDEIFKAPQGVCAGESNSNCNGQYFPFTDHTFDIIYDTDDAIIFETTQLAEPTFCVGELGGTVQLRSNCDGLNSVWVRDGNYLINVERTNTLDAAAFLTSSSASDKATLTASEIGTSGWKTWRIECAPPPLPCN